MKKTSLALAIQSAILLSGSASFAVLANQTNADQANANEPNTTSTQTTTQSELEQATTDSSERITVTGSRLRRDSFSIATPLVTIDKTAINDAGIGSLSEILVDHIPSINATISNTTSQSSVSSTGLSTISLRDLGTNRTLTLIDGRRVVSNSYNGNYVSLSTIASGMVERVEVISGGASATYGSDAVAGVVNIITQKDKQGFSFKSRTGETHDGGGKELTFDVDYGSEFAGGNGYVYMAATWDREFGMTFYDRPRAQIEDSYRYDDELMCNQMRTVTGYQCIRDITQADWASKSDGTLGGVFLESSRNETQFWYDGQTLRNDWKDNEEKYGINSQQFVMLKVPNDNLSTAIKVDYDFDSDTRAYAQIQYSRNETVNLKSPEDDYESAYVPRFDAVTGDPIADVRPGYIPIDNPFVPQEIIDSNPYKDRIYWDRRFGEVGPVTTDNTRTTIRSWAGVQGLAFDDEWEWDVSIGHGQFKQKQLRYNELNVVRVAQALQAERLEDGTIQCIDEDARAEGCVPLNLFGEGSITTEMADWIRTNPILETTIEQTNLLGYITGDLYDLPAGPISAVFGAEYRKDSQDLATSDDLREGGITWNVVPQFYGEVEVHEAFAEFALPLAKDAAWAKSLAAETSLRIADYSMDNVDLMASYKFGLTWEPSEGYMVRANYARAQRAPTITELMSPPRGDFDSFSDICNGLSATSTSPGHDNCRQEPSLAALLLEDPEFIFEDDNNGYSPNTGNSELKEETADTYTFGLTMAPTWLDNFYMAVDYYDISVTDAIDEISNSDIINECYNSSKAFGESNSFCNDITRDEEGNIIKILQREYNLNELNARGIDVALAYGFDFADGKVNLKADYTHVIEHSTTYQGNDGLETEHYAGFGSPKDKMSLSMTWSNDTWRVRYSTSWLGKFTASQSRQESHQEYMAANDERCAQGLETCIINPEPLMYQDYDSYAKHNLSFSYNIDLADKGNVNVFAGINNLFDDKGTFTLGGRGNFHSLYGTGAGRFFYLGAQYSF